MGKKEIIYIYSPSGRTNMSIKAIAKALSCLLAILPSGMCSAESVARKLRGHSIYSWSGSPYSWQLSALFVFRNSSQNEVWICDLFVYKVNCKYCVSRLPLGRLGEKRRWLGFTLFGKASFPWVCISPWNMDWGVCS